MDLNDCISPNSKQDSNNERKFSQKSKTTKKQQCSNFSIEHLLSSSFRSPTYQYLATPYRQIHSIFSKKKTKHFSDYYLHRIIQNLLHLNIQFNLKEDFFVIYLIYIII
jgi:hypothetical protein